MPTQHFIIEDRYLGTAERQSTTFRCGTSTSVFGHALFCPTCCDLWAKCPIDGCPSIVSRVDCRRHGRPNRYFIPGSVYLAWDPDFIEALPLEVLRREIEVHCDNLEKYENESD